MTANQEKNLVFRIIEFGLNKEVFTKRELYTGLGALGDQDTIDYVERYLVNQDRDRVSPTAIIGEVSRANDLNHLDFKHRLLSSAIFQYLDYLEIKAARESAKDAKRLSWIAIIISLVLGLAGILVQIILELLD